MDDADGREQIFEAAKKLFYRDGYTHTTMRAIAGEAGTSVGLPTYYFGSKEYLGVQIYCEVRNKLNELCLAYYPAPEYTADRRHLATICDLLLLIDHQTYRELYVNVASSPEMGTYMSSLLGSLLPELSGTDDKFRYLNSLTVSAVKARLVSADLDKYKLTRDELAKFMFQRYIRLQEHDYGDQSEELFQRFYREYHSFHFRMGPSFVLEYDTEMLRRRKELLQATSKAQ